MLSPLICKVPQLICLFRGRILPQTGSDIIYCMQAGIKSEVKIHDFTEWPPARPRGRGSPVPGLSNMKCSQLSVQGAAAGTHPSAAGGAKEGFSPSHSCRLRPGAGEWTGDNRGGVAQIPLKIFPNPRKYLGAAGTMAVCPPVIRHPPECGDTAGTGSSSRSSSLGHGHTTSPALDISGYIMHVIGDNL